MGDCHNQGWMNKLENNPKTSADDNELLLQPPTKKIKLDPFLKDNDPEDKIHTFKNEIKQEIKAEPFDEVEARDCSMIYFDHEDKIPVKEEIKQEIKYEPLDEVEDVHEESNDDVTKRASDISNIPLDHEDKILPIKIHVKTVQNEMSKDKNNGHESRKHFDCQKCGKSYTRKDHLKRHNLNIHGQKDISPVKKRENVVQEGVKKQHICQKCGKSFTRSDHLKRHTLNVHEKKNDDLNFAEQLSMMRQKSLPVIKYENEESSNNFMEENEIELGSSHSNMEENSEKIKNPLKYENEASNDDNVQEGEGHVKKKRKKEKSVYTCTLCAKVFERPSRLRLHVHVVHEGHKDFSCESCGKAFSRAQSLKFHKETVHEGKSPDFKCEQCGKLFTQGSGLNQHIRTIHEKQTIQCESCGKSFTQSSNLYLHVRTVHQGLRDFKCKVCEKDFSSLGYLKVHLKTVHDGLKEHVCDTCGRAFGCKSSLKKHRLTVHLGIKIYQGGKEHVCGTCGKVFTRSDKLKRHCMNVHGIGKVSDKQSQSFGTTPPVQAPPPLALYGATRGPQDSEQNYAENLSTMRKNLLPLPIFK